MRESGEYRDLSDSTIKGLERAANVVLVTANAETAPDTLRWAEETLVRGAYELRYRAEYRAERAKAKEGQPEEALAHADDLAPITFSQAIDEALGELDAERGE